MKLKIKSSTIEELQEELERNLIDLSGNVLLLECVCHCIQYHAEMMEYFDDEMIKECIRRVTNYIEQHTGEINSICDIIVKAQTTILH